MNAELEPYVIISFKPNEENFLVSDAQISYGSSITESGGSFLDVVRSCAKQICRECVIGPASDNRLCNPYTEGLDVNDRDQTSRLLIGNGIVSTDQPTPPDCVFRSSKLGLVLDQDGWFGGVKVETR